ncbi:MAG: hypothetical protein JWO50_126, partial [Candidatus Kaiserbacteria bacterium]|nr:hypothetical protein [Candidatus Kaiserbacteria bacterium]
KLSPISYHWNQLSGLDTTTSYSGFSAQNVQTAIPEAVGSSTNGFLTLQDRPILAATVNAIKDIGSVTGIFKDNLVAWLGNSSNGIQNFYTDNIHAKRADVQTLCIGSTCVTEAQLQQLLQNQNGIGGTPVVQPSNDSTSTVEESTSTADVATSTQL